MQLNDATFLRFSNWMRERAGVNLPLEKKPLLQQRLLKRLNARKVSSYEAYLRILGDPREDHEREMAIDLLTTHETFFFRESKHFDWLRDTVRQQFDSRPLHIWSAACSSGEEVWSLAMLLADVRGLDADWRITGSDISLPVLEKARMAHYPLTRTEGIPQPYLKAWCLKGVGSQHGTLLIDPALRKKADFLQVNLAQALPAIGPFQIVFMRNVLIYFDVPTKLAIIERVMSRIAHHGYLVVSHSESLQGLCPGLQALRPGVYKKL
ncbi:CheR family methyltransferase [Chitinilyticum piscinae]|uniref:Chemotaxis protein methyltransferase n=1 Tax=Chitinilyticum piscinae TaxID=2866724 RepID=A0A8J7FRN8_9NEIS|nr:CheR family methyltransferase [Chitinilyticum piscinae]MBE9609651.1 SAM-dependent methyltransferase [Chitinilyticum piscinae]